MTRLPLKPSINIVKLMLENLPPSYTCGKGRVAIVDYQNEKFGFWESERSFRRGQGCPFTPDVTYDYRAKPLYYEYYQSLLAILHYVKAILVNK
ncbi:MAG: hypothetical protein HY360_18115 [Verrucomicrobia bacterium]|nr:hypothetical protein [Verrucomicrobiota bacterium]